MRLLVRTFFIYFFTIFPGLHANANPMLFCMFMVKKADVDSIFKSWIAGTNLNEHPYDSPGVGWSNWTACRENINELIMSEDRDCMRSECESLHFVVLPCKDEYDTADSKRWKELRDFLEGHYATYEASDVVGKTDVSIRFRAFEWATGIWQRRQSLIKSRDRVRKIDSITKILNAKLQADPERMELNEKLVKTSYMRKIIADYRVDSEPLKQRVDEFIRKFAIYRAGFRDMQRKLLTIGNQAGETNCTSGSCVGSILFLQNEIEALELENRKISLQFEIQCEDLLFQLRNMIARFQLEIDPYKYVMKDATDFSDWEAPLVKTLIDIKAYSITRVVKFHEGAARVGDFIRTQAELRANRLAALQFNEATKKARHLKSSADFLRQVREQAAFLSQSPPSSGVLAMPFLKQRYRDYRQFIALTEVCDVAFNEHNSWMKTGCIHMGRAKKTVQKRLDSLPGEIKGYLIIARSIFDSEQVSDLTHTIEKLLDDQHTESAVELFDSLLVSMGKGKW